MNRKLAEIAAELDASRRVLLETAEGLDEARLAARPAPDAWSVGEVLEHVARVERSVTGLLRRLIDEGGLPPAWDDGLPVADRLDAFGIDVPTSRLDAPPTAVPTGGLSHEELLRALDGARRGVLELMEEASPLDLGAKVFPHPVVGPLDLYQWFLFLSKHERRHAVQARRAREAALGGSLEPTA